jgi:hypothetical protein
MVRDVERTWLCDDVERERDGAAEVEDEDRFIDSPRMGPRLPDSEFM